MEFNNNRNAFGNIPECKRSFIFFNLINSEISPSSHRLWVEKPTSLVQPRLIQFLSSLLLLSSKMMVFIKYFPTWKEMSTSMLTASHTGNAHAAWQAVSMSLTKLFLEVFCFHLCCYDKNSGQEQLRRGRSLLHCILPGYSVITESQSRSQKAILLTIPHIFNQGTHCQGCTV